MRVGSLFAGIGGFDLGFERAGMQTVWQVETDPYCLAVLARHFPDAERFGDVRGVGAHNLAPVDLICGGPPCQPTSLAGAGLVEDDERWLWPEFLRIVGELRPRYVLMENPAALLGRGMGIVLGGLAEIGYDAEWRCISAADMGAPHLRERVWILAHPDKERWERGRPDLQERRLCGGQPQGSAPPETWAQIPPPELRGVAHGIPSRVDRLSALGNALVPQIAQWIGERILAYEQEAMNHLSLQTKEAA